MGRAEQSDPETFDGSDGPGGAANPMLNPAWSVNRHLHDLHSRGGDGMAGRSIIRTALERHPSKIAGAVSERAGGHISAKGI
jgi:hypothetical protein